MLKVQNSDSASDKQECWQKSQKDSLIYNLKGARKGVDLVRERARKIGNKKVI